MDARRLVRAHRRQQSLARPRPVKQLAAGVRQLWRSSCELTPRNHSRASRDSQLSVPSGNVPAAWLTSRGGRAVIQVPDTLQHRTLLPGDERYDKARSVWNAMVDRRPEVIVQPATPREVVTAIRFARDNGLEIGVRCGGHSVVGHAVPDGGVMLDLSNLRAVTVDADARRCPSRRRCIAGRSGSRGAAVRACHDGGQRVTHGRRRLDSRRRYGLAGSPVTVFRATTSSRTRW